VPLSPSSITWYRPRDRWCSAAGKVTAGLAESSGSLQPGGLIVYNDYRWLIVTRRLTIIPVHRDQFRAQRSVTSMGSPFQCWKGFKNRLRFDGVIEYFYSPGKTGGNKIIVISSVSSFCDTVQYSRTRIAYNSVASLHVSETAGNQSNRRPV